MKSPKLIFLYIFLLSAVIITMMTMHKYIRPELRDYKEIKAEGILRIVTEYNQSGYYVSGDTIEGFQYELCRTISKISGLELQISPEMSLAESFKGLEDNKYDIIARNIPVTSKIREKYLFTDPVVLNKQVLVQRTAEANNSIPPIRNQLDLAKKTLYIPGDSPALLRIGNLQHEIGDTIYVVEENRYSSEQLIIMVAKGDIDYAVCDLQIATVSRNILPEIDVDTDISFTQLQSWAVRKESTALLDSLNYWFRIIRDNGTYDNIYKRYYKS
ncbi:MAG: transporter substrate-binding domain-containing protein [Tannerella sp.]|jgi:membrane-bound lytic murein transglycosylase MltF|nr:transporter substrate-binding domain-containing protein [Tannerella sp.]